MILSLLCLSAFFAGFVDSIVGGGGLIQLPAVMALLPDLPVATLLGTNKFSSIFGTGLAIIRYSKKQVRVPSKIIALSAVVAFFTSWWGALFISKLPSESIKPVIILILLGVFVFTLFHKNFGAQDRGLRITSSRILKVLVGAAVIGFYDGFLGPGTGGFLIFLFIASLGLSFLSASASAKWVNFATNLSAIIYFIATNHIVYKFAVPMAACNMIGSYAGTHMAVKRGAGFVRLLFIALIFLIFLKLSYDIL